MILAVDTSTEMTSVALTRGDEVVAERRHRDPRRHAEVTAPLLAELLAGVDPAAIAAVACGVGPGPYTGLRVGVSTARALGLAWSVPVLGLCSLDAIAAAWHATAPDGPFGVAADARRREVYWAVYDVDGLRTHGPQVNAPDAVAAAAGDLPWAGRGAALHPEAFGRAIPDAEDDSALAYPAASWIGRRVGALLAQGVRPSAPVVELVRHGEDGAATARALAGTALLPPAPLYLRRADTTEPRPA